MNDVMVVEMALEAQRECFLGAIHYIIYFTWLDANIWIKVLHFS